MSRVRELLNSYNFSPTKPLYTANLLSVFEGTNKETGTKVAIKIFKRADQELATYLGKMKSAASEQVVRIYEIINEP